MCDNNKFKITLLQTDIAWNNREANALNAEQMIAENPGSDLYVLPEMWTTGFATAPKGIAENKGEGLDIMKQLAQKTNAAIAGSIATQVDENDFRNRFYFVEPNGKTTFYDKHHLFTYGGEHLEYSAGTERIVIDFRGVKFKLIVCYDLRFPVWCRNTDNYDCIICVASWPTPRIEAWSTLLKARAIENQCFFAGVNRVGTDPSCEYSGGTALIDPYGKTIVECERGKQQAISTILDLEQLCAFRQKFPVLNDKDCFSL